LAHPALPEIILRRREMETLTQLATWLSLNPWLSILSFLLALLGVILAVVFFIKSRRMKEPRFAIRSFNLVRDFTSRLEALEMLYAGQRIQNLTVSKIAFWNNGAETINGQDIASADPLVAKLKEGLTILDASVLFVKNEANQFSIDVSDDSSELFLKFDYVDKGEGVVIQVLHTGRSSADIQLAGTIKGGGKPIEQFFPRLRPLMRLMPSSFSPARRRRLVGILFFGMSAMLLALPFLSFLVPGKGAAATTDRIFLAVCAFMCLVYFAMGFYVIRRRIPSGFDVFEEL